jgi:hypothetical protein
MADRFDLEQQILDCWKITDDIAMMEAQGANTADMTSLACVYEYKFERLWEIFEGMVHEQQFKSSEEFFESGKELARKLDKKNKKRDGTTS